MGARKGCSKANHLSLPASRSIQCNVVSDEKEEFASIPQALRLLRSAPRASKSPQKSLQFDIALSNKFYWVSVVFGSKNARLYKYIGENIQN